MTLFYMTVLLIQLFSFQVCASQDVEESKQVANYPSFFLHQASKRWQEYKDLKGQYDTQESTLTTNKDLKGYNETQKPILIPKKMFVALLPSLVGVGMVGANIFFKGEISLQVKKEVYFPVFMTFFPFGCILFNKIKTQLLFVPSLFPNLEDKYKAALLSLEPELLERQLMNQILETIDYSNLKLKYEKLATEDPEAILEGLYTLFGEFIKHHERYNKENVDLLEDINRTLYSQAGGRQEKITLKDIELITVFNKIVPSLKSSERRKYFEMFRKWEIINNDKHIDLYYREMFE